MRANEGYYFPAQAATTAEFILQGGRYAIAISGVTGTGTQTLNKRNGANFVAVPNSTVTGGGTTWVVVEVPPGSYKLVLASALTADLLIERVPGE